jgi:hypothetical protein
MRPSHPFLIFGVTVALTGPARALHAQPPSTCGETADSLVAFVGRNYIAPRMDTTADGPAAALRRAPTSAAGRRLDPLPCYLALREWVEEFRDGHLFLLESTRLDSAESARRAASVRRLAVDQVALRRRLARPGPRDPVEGIWYDRGLRVAVVPDPVGPRGALVAVVLDADTAGWMPGAVRARFTIRPDGSYDAALAERNHAQRHLVARLHRGVLLRMPPHMWGREAPAPRGELLDTLDPRRPTLRSEGRAVVLAVPSFDPERVGPLPRLLRAWHDRILAADPFVIDLRGNEGGSSLAARPLLAYVQGEPERPAAYPDWQPMVLASADHVAWLRSQPPADGAAPPWATRLLARMEAAPDEVVPYMLPEELPARWRPGTTHAGPKRVVVVVDGGVMSAGESFVLEALRSPRVVLTGEPTAGVHDYQNTRIVAVGRGEHRFLLGYPTLAGHPRFPDGGINRVGIRPSRPFPVGEGEGWAR